MPPPTATRGAGECGHNRSGHRQRQQRRLGNVLHDAQKIGEKRMLGDMDAEQFRELIQQDYESDPCLEAG